MNNISIAIHGGAGPDSDFIKQNEEGYKSGLKNALLAGYQILEKGGTALAAVEAAVRHLEDNELFNAGRGSALNNKGEVEMDAAIMDGEKGRAGAVAVVKNVRHPISLARSVMEKTNHVLLCAKGALDHARDAGLQLETDDYFITPHQYDTYKEEHDAKTEQDLMMQKKHGTVGAVAVDRNGNVAAATSTGGTSNSLEGRIGDSCLIGAGCYAHNNTCAISGTGDGEFLINGVVAHSVAAALEYTHCTVQQACDLVIHQKNKDSQGDMGVISVDKNGNIGISFNSERMHRASIGAMHPLMVSIY